MSVDEDNSSICYYLSLYSVLCFTDLFLIESCFYFHVSGDKVQNKSGGQLLLFEVCLNAVYWLTRVWCFNLFSARLWFPNWHAFKDWCDEVVEMCYFEINDIWLSLNTGICNWKTEKTFQEQLWSFSGSRRRRSRRKMNRHLYGSMIFHSNESAFCASLSHEHAEIWLALTLLILICIICSIFSLSLP